VSELECIIDKGINRQNNIAGFACAGIHSINQELITTPLPLKCPSFLLSNTVRKRNIFNISNQVVTNPEFLNEWEEDIRIKKELKEKKTDDKEKEVWFIIMYD
jgi:hypothetical protein